MIQLPQLQESLLIANERLVDRARRRARLFRTGLMTSAAVVSVGGVAAAGIALWDPPLGHEDGNRPSVSQTPVPADQQALLGVFRRDQVAADRGVIAQRALVAFSRQYRGIRVGAIRVLGSTGPASGIALVPVADLDRADGVPDSERIPDALCSYTTTGGDAQTVGCFTTDELRRGQVVRGIGDVIWGVVPDGVASVAVHRPGGSTDVVPVTSNAFDVRASTVDPSRPDVEWLDGEGRAVPPEGGAPMRLPVAVTPTTTGGAGFHDCGADGGVVPVDVTCGAAARRWRPEPGVPTPTSAPKAK